MHIPTWFLVDAGTQVEFDIRPHDTIRATTHQIHAVFVQLTTHCSYRG